MYTFSLYPRIAVDPEICEGKPHILGTRLTISAILAYLAGGMKIEEFSEAFPQVKKEDVFQALGFASGLLQDQIIPLSKTA
ncbi:MAG: DUF433 domain-containing protein [Bacteroidia bacterium]